jgi:hypothetical protein
MTSMRMLFRFVAALTLAALAQPAAWAEGLVSAKRLSASLAAELAMAAITACAQKEYHVGVVVLDYSGVQQVALRGDGAAPQNVLNANDKGHRYGRPRRALEDRPGVERFRQGTPSAAQRRRRRDQGRR